MIAAIVVYVLIVTLPLIAAAVLMEHALKLWRWPLRGVWAASLLATVALAGRAIIRQSNSAESATQLVSIRSVRSLAHAQPGVLENIRMLTGAITSFPLSAAGYVARLGGSAPNGALIALWCTASLSMLGFICFVYIRIGFERRRWTVAQFAGQRVHVAPHAGPAVVGLLRPEIVIPQWMLDSSAGDPGLVVMHEMEHRNAHDPLLLAAAWALVALIPWHPGAWYCLARTRLAIELDCDARVITHGASLRTYAELLVNQARVRLGAPLHLWLGATSLLEPSSHLERRLNAMIHPTDSSVAPRRFGRLLRTFPLLAIASTVAIAACESHVPTAADISGLDVASAERDARQASMIGAHPVVYYVNGAHVSADTARAIEARNISSISVVTRNEASKQQEIRITTIGAPITGDSARALKTVRVTLAPGGAATVRPYGAPSGSDIRVTVHPRAFDPSEAPAIVIDGAPSTAEAMNALNPSTIATVDILKGPAAMRESTDPLAKNGLIRITLKH
ncbi:MAG: M56 family metallopeptidase [Gemmatimonadota bacterium]|nr:M56 family metallopeptidase [Gemmatimonadota bacterium]